MGAVVGGRQAIKWVLNGITRVWMILELGLLIIRVVCIVLGWWLLSARGKSDEFFAYFLYEAFQEVGNT